jgi:hypothetical protein
MTSVIEMTLDELTRKIEKLKDLGWIRSYRRGNTGVGHTMEGLLGYGENPLALPDWGIFEIKTTRRDSKTPVTLLSKTPKRIPGISREEFMRDHGYWDEERKRQALYCTLNAIKENSLGWILSISRAEGLINFIHNKEVIATQDVSSLQKKFEEKITNLVLIIADRKKDGKDEYFRYSEAYLLAKADIDRLLDLLESGDITFDWRMHLKKSGTVRDHGPGYRMLETKLPKLYNHIERLV